MPSVDIENGHKSEPSRFVRVVKKICCCSTSVKPESSVELTKAQTVTEQPTSSRISVIKRNAFDDEEVDKDFHSVELRVPESDESKAQSNKLKSSNAVNGKLDRRQDDLDEIEAKESPIEEVPPDTEFLNVIEEATDSEIAVSVGKANGLVQSAKVNGTATVIDTKLITPPVASMAKEKEQKEEVTDETVQLITSDKEAAPIFETTAPIENGDFKVLSIRRTVELDEMNDKRMPWSPQKPPRRASQLNAPLVLPISDEQAVQEISLDSIEPEVESTESTDDGIVPDIVLTRQPDIEQEALTTVVPMEAIAKSETLPDESSAIATIVTGTDDAGAEHVLKVTEELTDKPQEQMRSIGTMAVDLNPESDYEDSLSTTVTEQSYNPDDEAPTEFVTRLSVRSNGEVLVSSPAFNGPIVKVKLGSIKEGLTTFNDEDLSGRIV